MWQFVKNTLSTIVGLFLFSILAILILVGVGTVMSNSDEHVDLKENSILKINLDRPMVENASTEENPLADLAGPFVDNSEKVGLIQILSALERAKVDSKIKGIQLEATLPFAGYSQLSEVREALEDFKKSGKFILSYADSYTEKGYYVASVADEVYLNPNGLLDFNGIAANYTFFKKALDKLEIEPLIFRVGQYKSAVEPFIRENMSDENKEQTISFLNSINNFVFDKIARSRSLTVPKLNQIADSLSAYSSNNAAKLGMVKLAYQDEYQAVLMKKMKVKEVKDLVYISLNDYLKAENPIKEVEGNAKIAVLVAEGEIVGTKGGEGSIGSESFIKELRKLRDNKSVKAIVLRIDSPGGSSLASDNMWREIQLAKKVKPIIASMSTYAASGGYYMAMGTDQIVAHPTTITGSIGIFAQWLNLDKFLSNKLGITHDHVNTNAHSNFMTTPGELSDFEKQLVQKFVDEGYESFTSKAAAGRKMSIQKLKSVAGGRVWTGAQAKQIGLVDELGGLNTAIALAAKKVNLKAGTFKVTVYPKAKSFIESFLESATSDAKISDRILQKHVPWASSIMEINRIKQREGLQALMPYMIELN
ncbi:MAG: Protease [Bacteroidota bacterium]|jgi:protease-4